jgi:hypothetical protein
VHVTTRPDGTRWTALGGQWVQVFTRSEFLHERWDYQNGEHVSIFGPTQIAGKTRLMFDLLAHTDTSGLRLPPTMLVAKPRDMTVVGGIQRLAYKETDRWPPKRGWFRKTPPGYAYWPPHLRDVTPEENDEHIARMFRPAVHELFWRGDTITVADELYHLLAVLRLYGDVNRHLTQGMGMGSGIWFGTQRPAGTQQGSLPGFVFNSPTHTFLSRDPVEANRKRFREIGGVSTDIVEEATYTMPPFWFFYIHRNGPKICIVEAA